MLVPVPLISSSAQSGVAGSLLAGGVLQLPLWRQCAG